MTSMEYAERDIARGEAETTSERVYRVSLTVDEGWLAWLQQNAQYVEHDEVFTIRTIVDEDELDEEPDAGWTVAFVGDREHEAWALVAPNGEVDNSHWYDTEMDAFKAGCTRVLAGWAPPTTSKGA